MSEKWVAVVGAGVVGLCVAYSAMRRGHSVTVVDRGSRDGDRCSLGNAGIIVPSHFIPLASPGMLAQGLKMLLDPESPFSVRLRPDHALLRWGILFAKSANAGHVDRSAGLLRDLNLAGRELYSEMAERFQKPFDFKPNGLLMLCKSEKTLEEEAHVAEMACKLGIPSQVLDAKKAAELEPDLRMDIAGAVHFPMDCSLDPAMLVDSLIGELEAGGVAFEWNCEATGWRTTGERITGLETKRKQIVADEFVVAGGSWTPDLVSGLGLNLPLQAGKGYSMTLSNPRQLPKACSILTEARVAVTPMAGKLRFAGTLEIAGNDLAIRQSRVRGIIKSIPQYFPDFRADDFDNVAFWSGLRPCSPDGVPYIGRFRRYANLSVAAGHAMMGVSLAPVTGEIIADIVSEEAVDQASITPIPGRSATVDLRQLSPDRFQ